jgi:hypothetical protein
MPIFHGEKKDFLPTQYRSPPAFTIAELKPDSLILLIASSTA